MARVVVLTVCCCVLAAQAASAGQNPSVQLAMHLVASSEYLDCADLMPAACESINVDLSMEELQAVGGYGHVAFIAYDVEAITAVEFALAGWPTGRGAPPLDGPHWCPEGAMTYGDHMEDGGATAFGSCAEPDENGMVLLGYASFGPLEVEDLPVFLEYAPSTYSESLNPQIAVTDCTPDYVVDPAIFTTGCTIGGTQPDGPWCEGGEIMAGEGEGGGLVWAMLLERVDRKRLREEYLDSDRYLLPGKEFPLPGISCHHNHLSARLEGTSRGCFPISYLRVVLEGEPLWTAGFEGSRTTIDAEWYVGFLPVNPDGTLPEEGIDWWSWDRGKSVEPQKWVKPDFLWSDEAAGIDISFSGGNLRFQGPGGVEADIRVSYGNACVATFERTSGRLAIAGYDEALSEWHLTVLDAEGKVVFRDPWRVAPTTHLHPSQDGTYLLYAAWEDKQTASLRPHVHPIPQGQPKGPPEPSDHPSLGAYRVSLRTGTVTKVPSLEGIKQNRECVPWTPEPYADSPDCRYRVKVQKKNGAWTPYVGYYDMTDPKSPTLLWERWEGRWVQNLALSAAGTYVAEIFWGEYWPQGPSGPSQTENTTVFRLRNKSGFEMCTQVYEEGSGPYAPSMVFQGPYLFLGYDGTGMYTRCIYLHDMREPQTGGGR